MKPFEHIITARVTVMKISLILNTFKHIFIHYFTQFSFQQKQQVITILVRIVLAIKRIILSLHTNFLLIFIKHFNFT